MVENGPRTGRARLRLAALLAVLWAGLVGLACSRETFDLLPPMNGAKAGAGGSVAGASGGGATSSSGGSATASGGASAGNGGTPLGAGGGQPPCLAGEPCTDGGLDCPPNVPFCKRCADERDCDSFARFCNVESGRCSECRSAGNDCPQGERCDSLTLRCSKACDANSQCDSKQPICDPFRNVCVACTENGHCLALNGQNEQFCVTGYCVECYSDAQCRPDKPLCRALRCQAR